MQVYFEEPVRVYPQAVGAAGTVSGLIDLLSDSLAQGVEADCSASALADRIAALGRPDRPTGFPGLPGSSGTRDRFERIIKEISR